MLDDRDQHRLRLLGFMTVPLTQLGRDNVGVPTTSYFVGMLVTLGCAFDRVNEGPETVHLYRNLSGECFVRAR